MSDELDILKSVAQALEKEKIPYMITGSIAANFYTEPRMTRDIDIVIEIDLKDIGKIFNAFKDSYYIDEGAIKGAIEHQSSFNIIHNEKLVKVDFLIKKYSDFDKEEFDRRIFVDLAGINLSIITPEDLIISKLYWAKDSYSETQLKDISNIIKKVENLDYNYLDDWINKLGLEQIFSKVNK